MGQRIFIKGIPFDRVTRKEAVRLILTALTEEKSFFVTTPNPEFIVESSKHPAFKKILQTADLSLPDGIGILWAATFLRLKAESLKFKVFWQAFNTLLWILLQPQKIRQVLPERVCGSDLLLDLCAQTTAKVFFLGAREGVAEKAAKILQQKNPQLKIVGAYAGNPNDADLINKINTAETELLFVAYGSSKQEFWLAQNLARLKTVKVAIGVGGSFDFVAGIQKRAPFLLRKVGLEWLWRLIREPKRFRRIWNATGVFVGLIIQEKLNQ